MTDTVKKCVGAGNRHPDSSEMYCSKCATNTPTKPKKVRHNPRIEPLNGHSGSGGETDGEHLRESTKLSDSSQESQDEFDKKFYGRDYFSNADSYQEIKSFISKVEQSAYERGVEEGKKNKNGGYHPDTIYVEKHDWRWNETY